MDIWFKNCLWPFHDTSIQTEGISCILQYVLIYIVYVLQNYIYEPYVILLTNVTPINLNNFFKKLKKQEQIKSISCFYVFWFG